MAEIKKPYLSIIHGLDIGQEFEKRIVCKRKDNRWHIKIDIAEGSTILTPRDITSLRRALIVARRRMEMVYRRTVRMEKRKEVTSAS